MQFRCGLTRFEKQLRKAKPSPEALSAFLLCRDDAVRAYGRKEYELAQGHYIVCSNMAKGEIIPYAEEKR
jgi:hypothetical protein